MKKRTSILLTIAAIASLAAVPVMAVGCGHEHNYDQLKSEDSQHWYECSCGEKDPKGPEDCYDNDGNGKCDVCDADVHFFKTSEVGVYTYKYSAELENYRALQLNADGTGVYALITDTTYLDGNDVTCEKINEGNYKYKFVDGEDGETVKFYFAQDGALMLAYANDSVVTYNKEEDFNMPEPARELKTGKYEGEYQNGDDTVTVAFSIYESLDTGYYTDSLGTDYECIITGNIFANRISGFFGNVVANADDTITLTVNGTSFNLTKTGPAEEYVERPDVPNPDTEGTTYTGHDPDLDLDVTVVINADWTEAILTNSEGEITVLSLTETENGVYAYADEYNWMVGTITINPDGTLTVYDSTYDYDYIVTKTQE